MTAHLLCLLVDENVEILGLEVGGWVKAHQLQEHGKGSNVL